MQNKAIFIACRKDSIKALKLARNIFDFLKSKNQLVYLEHKIAPIISEESGKDLKTINTENTKFIISIGGDGTLLNIINKLCQIKSPPILGVNFGSVGFLEESNIKSIYKDLMNILNENYFIEKHSKISAFLVKNRFEEYKLGNALNEILIISSKFSKVLHLTIKINGVFFSHCFLDGVIITTSTGSTAYNLSAGGAIISPDLDAIELTPLNNFARNGLKPIVLPINTEIEIENLRPTLNATIIIDGQRTIKNINPKAIIKIRKANCYTEFIRVSNSIQKNYINRLREKIIGSFKIPLNNPSIS
jgi:NAD+ kinase